MAIRYDSKLNREIQRTVKNFNQKVARLEKLDKVAPEKVSTKELKQYYSRAELQRRLKQLQGFSTRGAEDVIELKSGAKITKYEYNIIKRETTRAKRQVSKQINFYEKTKVKIAGKEQSTTFARTGDDDYLIQKARKEILSKDINKLSGEEISSFWKLVQKINRNKEYMNSQFKENYFEMFSDLGYYTGYDSEKLKYIKAKMMQLNPNQFFQMFREDKAIKTIVEYYRARKSGNIRKRDLDQLEKDVAVLYDTIYENIDSIIEPYA